MLKHIHLKHIRTNTFILVFLLLTSFTHAKEPIPPTLREVGVVEKIGNQIDTTLYFKNHLGQPVQLNKFFDSGKPTIINIAYYSCPMLCHLVAGGVADGINTLNLKLGVDYQVLSISIDPADSTETASAFREKYLQSLKVRSEEGWQFLYGNKEEITKLTEQLGFMYKFNPKSNEFAHSAAIILLDNEATISRYLYGIEYKSFDLKMGLLESKDIHKRSAVERVLLFCYNYDPLSRKYVLFAQNAMRIGGVITILLMIFGFITLQRTRNKEFK